MSSVQGASFGERNFKYLLVGPAIFVLLLIGVFPLVYLLTVSFQGITMTETGTDFIGECFRHSQRKAVAPLLKCHLHVSVSDLESTIYNADTASAVVAQ